MGKKKNHSAPAAAESSSSAATKAIEDLRALNNHLVKELVSCRREMNNLKIQLAALASPHNILVGSEPNVPEIQRGENSSSVIEAAAKDNREKMTQSETAQLNAQEMRLLAVVGEKEDIQSNLEHITEEKDCAMLSFDMSLEQSRKKSQVELAESEQIATERQSDNSSSTTEGATQDNTEMSNKMTESAVAQLDVAEMRQEAVVREKDEFQSNLERIIAEKDNTILSMEKSLEQWRKKSDAELVGGRKWKRLICSAVIATVSFGVAAAIATYCCPKISNSKN